MRRAIAVVALGMMAVGLFLSAFGTVVLPLLQSLFANPNPCSAANPCHPVSSPVYHMEPQLLQGSQPTLGLNFVGAGLALIGAALFGALYRTRNERLPARLLSHP